MRKSDNSNPEICLLNLFNMHSGEVLMDRARGIDLNTDSAVTEIDIVSEIEKVVDNQEQRVSFKAGKKIVMDNLGNIQRNVEIKAGGNDE